jgi:ATP-dependent Clp protease ATP-binding subunit ClpC
VGAPPPSDAAADIVAAAEREARTLRHTRIGTEHLLLGVLGRTDEAGARALERLGVTLGAARAQVMRIVGLPETPSPPTLPLTPPARDALGGALREAIELGETTVASQHILLAILRERDSVAVRVLRDAGVAPGRLREEIAAASAAAEEARSTGAAAGRTPPAATAIDGTLGAHALLGVLAAGGPAADLLRAHGVDEAAVRGLLADAAS